MRWQTPERLAGAPRVTDAALAAGVAVLGAASGLGATQQYHHARPAVVAILAAMGLILFFRRRFPGVVLAGEAGLVAGLVALHASLEGSFLAVLCASYSAAVHGTRRLAIGLAAAAAAVLAAMVVAVVLGVEPWLRAHVPLPTILAAAGAWWVGWVIRRQFSLRAAQLDLLAERAELMAQHQQEQARRVRADERLRIARELHDIVAHHISVVVIQAQGAQRMAGRDPARARAAMADVECTGRTALDEMRRLLGLLRSGETGAETEAGDQACPVRPGLPDIEALAERMRSAGLAVSVQTTGTPAEVPDDIGLAAYRIVQEALTNALKHAGPARVTVGLDFTAGLEISVADDGRGAAARLTGTGLPGAGRGIAGMAERAAAAGGNLTAGPRAGGGFSVRATIPLGGR